SSGGATAEAYHPPRLLPGRGTMRSMVEGSFRCRKEDPFTAFGGSPPHEIVGRVSKLLHEADAGPLVAHMAVEGVGLAAVVVAGDFDQLAAALSAPALGSLDQHS